MALHSSPPCPLYQSSSLCPAANISHILPSIDPLHPPYSLAHATHQMHRVRPHHTSIPAMSPTLSKVPTTLTTALLLLILAAQTAPTHAQVATPQPTCAPGSFQTNTSCQDCPKGTYQDEAGQHDCKKCPAGFHSNIPGLAFSWMCEVCPWGTTSRAGQSHCTRCPTGQFYSDRMRKCTSCPAGTVVLRSGRCFTCRPARFAATPNSPTCLDCPRQHFSTADRTRCVFQACPPGSIFRPFVDRSKKGNGKCRTCFRGEFRAAGMRECGPCPTRRVPNHDRSACVTCRPGTRLAGLLHIRPGRPGLSERLSCEPCERGSTAGVSKPICRVDGAPCPEGFFADADGDCNRCAPGEFRDVRANRCRKCALGQWSVGGLSPVCSTCSGGRAPTLYWWGTSPCECPSNAIFRNGRCQQCPPGTAKRYENLCRPCDAFSFNEGGRPHCMRCPWGTISTPTGGKSCTPFPKCGKGKVLTGDFYEFGARTCVSVKTGCPDGLVNRWPSAHPHICVDGDGKLQCPAGSVHDGSDKLPLCLRCAAGEVLVKGARKARCDECPAGWTSPGGLVSRCKKCPPGFKNTRGSEACYCRSNHTVNADGACVKCPARFSLPVGRRPSDCEGETILYNH